MVEEGFRFVGFVGYTVAADCIVGFDFVVDCIVDFVVGCIVVDCIVGCIVEFVGYIVEFVVDFFVCFFADSLQFPLKMKKSIIYLLNEN